MATEYVGTSEMNILHQLGKLFPNGVLENLQLLPKHYMGFKRKLINSSQKLEKLFPNEIFGNHVKYSPLQHLCKKVGSPSPLIRNNQESEFREVQHQVAVACNI